MDSATAFSGYVVDTRETGLSYLVVVVAYTLVSFLLLGPCLSLSQQGTNPSDEDSPEKGGDSGCPTDPSTINNGNDNNNNKGAEKNNQQSAPDLELETTTPQQEQEQQQGRHSNDITSTTNDNDSKGMQAKRVSSEDGLSELTSHLSGSVRQKSAISATHTARSSSMRSSTSTARLYNMTAGQPQAAIGGRRRRQHRRAVERVVELRSSDLEAHNKAINSINHHLRRPSLSSKVYSSKGLSDVASNILEEQISEGSVYNRALLRKRFRRGISFSSSSARSIMPPIIDDISPNDAADADDPGLIPHQQFIQANKLHRDDNTPPLLKVHCLSSMITKLLDLAEIGPETVKLCQDSLSIFVETVWEPLLHVIIIALVANFIDSQSMVAFILVSFIVRRSTDEVSNAISDTLATFVEGLMCGEEDIDNAPVVAGQYIQLSLIMQVIVNVPLLLLWAFFVDGVVAWFADSNQIGAIAGDYTRVVVFDYFVQALSKTFSVAVQIVGKDRYESHIDATSSVMSVLMIAIVTGFVDGADLPMVGYIQILVAAAAGIAKIAYPVHQGWIQPFHVGLFCTFALYENFNGFSKLAYGTIPLFLGSVLEYGEWELLSFCIRYLGPAEAVTWVLVGCVWQVLQAPIDALGEAGATRVGYLLAIFQPAPAEHVSNVILYLSVIGSCLVTSILFLLGRFISVILITDFTMQHMFFGIILYMGLANVAFAFGQVSWSLLGSQGRLQLTTIVMFVCRWLVTMPIALIAIFGFNAELNALGGALTVGGATASCILTYLVLRTDWSLVSQMLQEMNVLDDDGDDDDELDGSEFSNDSDDDDVSDEGDNLDKSSEGSSSLM